MRKILKGFILFILIAGIAFLMPGLMDSTQYTIKAGEAEWSQETGGTSGGTSGTDTSAAFTVVEIVPYEGMGEVGYLIGGQEPVNQEYMSYWGAKGGLSFLGNAITVYHSYEESALPASGTADSGWTLEHTVVNQNGYFEYVGYIGYDKGARYDQTYGDNYMRVADGKGNYSAVIASGTDMDYVINTDNSSTNKKNVNAYFVYGKPSGIGIFNLYNAYKPYSVKTNPTHTGDYDYDASKGTFIINKGVGKYDVIFARDDWGGYYMMDNYEIIENNTGDYSFNLSYIHDSDGNYIKETGSYYTYSRYSGKYRWVQNDTFNIPYNYYTDANGRIWVKNQRVVTDFQFRYKTQLVNNEWFKQLTLGIPADQIDSYKVKVITMTPEKLSLPENRSIIENADMFYINANYSHNHYIMLYELYNSVGRSLPDSEKYFSGYWDNANYYGKKDKVANLNFAVHDLDWATTKLIFKRAAGIGCKKAAMVIDNTYYSNAVSGDTSLPYAALCRSVTLSYGGTSNGTMCNLAKLYIMVYQRNMVDFYNSFMQETDPTIKTRLITQVDTTVNKSGYTGSFIRPDSSNPSPTANEAIYWNGNTFLPYGLDENGEMVKYTNETGNSHKAIVDLYSQGVYNANIQADPMNLTNNVLTTSGTDIFTSNFYNPYFNPVKGIGMSDLVNYITNGGEGFKNVGGVSYPEGSYVEGVQPEEDEKDTTDDGNDGSGLRGYKRVLNIQPTADFSSSEEKIKKILTGYNVQIINMTTVQFNGCREDINALYDMIYIGRSTGRFNHGYYNQTVFNDSQYMYMYYFKEGDIIRLNNGTDIRYRGNDITNQKRKELEDYLEGGFPVVADSDVYSCNSFLSKDYPMEYTTKENLRLFIEYAKSRHIKNLFSENNYSYYKTNFETALNIARPVIDLILPELKADAKVIYNYVDSTSEKLTLRFSLLPRGKSALYTYNALLYVDEDRNGIFDEEPANVTSKDSSTWEKLHADSSVKNDFYYKMAGKNGAYQWKIVVQRSDNPYIYSTVTGYAANSSKKNIYILQIRDNIDSYSLKSKVNDTSSLVYQYAGDNKLDDYNLIFDTMTVQEFEKLYIDSPYTTAKAATTNKLSKYHILIMDNPNVAISNTFGAVDNIRDEVINKLNIIFTKGTLSNNNQSLFFETGKTSLLSGRTYNYINYNASNFYYYKIFNSLSTNGILTNADTYLTNYLTKSNEGTITRYPYNINRAIKIAANNYSDDVTIDYNLADSQKLVGWYCLSDSKSPVVRSEGIYTGGIEADLFKGMYSSSPNDVKNNYYLFSFGSCYYSGINLVKSDSSEYENEIKLFVNTMIAAYSATDRTVSNPPKIVIEDPVPKTAADLSQYIDVKPESIEGTDFILTFKITDSSSKMDLEVLLEGKDPLGNWNDNIHEVGTDGTLGPALSISTTHNLVENKTYALVIPITEIAGTNKLTFTAVNMEGSAATKDVTLNYVQLPEISIKDPEPLIGKSTNYIYADIDFDTLDLNEDDVSEASDLRIEFEVTKSLTNVFLSATSEEELLTDGIGKDVAIYSKDDLTTKLDLTKELPKEGTYVMDIPMELMKDYSSRAFTITATDLSGNEGIVSVTLLRRSLFPLD